MSMPAYLVNFSASFRLFSRVLLLAYFTGLIWLLFFYASSDYARGSHNENTTAHNFTPFSSIKSYLVSLPDYYQYHGMRTWLMNVVGNLCLYLPAGFLLPIAKLPKLGSTFRGIMGAGLLWIIATETLQGLLNRGIFDIDDILLNGTGLAIGWLCFTALAACYKWFFTGSQQNAAHY